MKNENCIIKLNEYGTQSIGARVIGVNIKNNVINIINQNPGIKVMFDFEGINYISTGFAKELFGELFKELGNRFTTQILIKTPPNSLIKDIIIKGIQSVI